jgi:coenzyme PQQ precursor peptide PqqA
LISRTATKRSLSLERIGRARSSLEENMTEVTWTAPEACEVCVGMEVTSYMSAEI